MIPMRLLFRSRWIALAWAFSICCTAIHFAGDLPAAAVDAADSADSNAAQNSALAAEDD